MFFKTPDTLASFNNELLTSVNTSMKTMQVPVIAARCEAYSKTCGLVMPDTEAFNFYLLNHAASQLKAQFAPDEPMGGKEYLYNYYMSEASAIALRIFYYTLLIITRESRHLKSSGSLHDTLKADYGYEFIKFHQSIKGSSSDSAVYNFYQDPPSMELGAYVKGIFTIFNEGSFNGGYGGKPWAEIAKTLLKVVEGEITLEIFADTAYTLAHNNGAIFNKGMMYDHYGNGFGTILDVQRAGLLPQLYSELHVYEVGVTKASLSGAYKLIKDHIPNFFDGFVDWFLVENLGSLKKYPAYKKAQVLAHGDSPAGSLPATVSDNKLWITDSEYINIVQRKKAA